MSNAWRDTGPATLLPIEAYDAMCVFLRAYWERGGRSSDDIAILLGMVSRNRDGELPPIDMAQWHDWLDAVATVKGLAHAGGAV